MVSPLIFLRSPLWHPRIFDFSGFSAAEKRGHATTEKSDQLLNGTTKSASPTRPETRSNALDKSPDSASFQRNRPEQLEMTHRLADGVLN
jgi:hypothetical protein